MISIFCSFVRHMFTLKGVTNQILLIKITKFILTLMALIYIQTQVPLTVRPSSLVHYHIDQWTRFPGTQYAKT